MALFYALSHMVVRRSSCGEIRAAAGGLFAATILATSLLSGCGPRAAGETGVPPGVGTAAARRALCPRIDAALAHARDSRRLDADEQGAWQVVHGILAFGTGFPLRHDGTESSAVDYLLGGGQLAGWRLRSGSRGVFAAVEQGSTTAQGHPDQWLGYLSQCGLGGIPRDTAVVVGGRRFTVDDLLTQAQADIRPGQEATWTLMALAAYLPPDAAWTSSDGQRWTTERVVRMEAEADIPSSACGGAHRLYALARAVRTKCDATGLPAEQLTGGWAEAASVVADCVDRARRFQQSDGSFSVHSFERPGSSPDAVATLGTTGHVFEVLAVALDDEQLAEPWVTRAAERLVALLESTADVDVECGALYHAAHGLLLYRQRTCGSTD